MRACAVLQGRRRNDQVALARLSALWPTAEVREAAWDDLIEACRDITVSYGTLAIRRDIFWQLMEAADHDVDWMSNLLPGVLGDAAFYIAQARFWLGDTTATDAVLPQPNHAAGLPECGRSRNYAIVDSQTTCD
jgi:hypothetical protein